MIVVTGATGFIGSNLLFELEKRCYANNIIAVDSYGKGDKYKNIIKRRNVQIVLPNQLRDFLNNHTKDINAIIHLGAISSTTESDVDLIVENNIQLTLYIYEYCKTHNIRFIYASSASVYGDGHLGFDDTEDMEYLNMLVPLNPYAWSKLYVDKYILSDQQKCLTCNSVGLRFFNVYGPNEYHKGGQMSVMNKFYHQAVSNGTISLFKSSYPNILDGEQKRDFIFVDDCVHVISWLLENNHVSGIYNVGTGFARSYNAVANVIFKELDIDSNIRYINMPEKLASQYQNYTQANISKLRSIGYNCEMATIEQGISLYINNYLNKSDQYK
jgi:ADP-L-glycero-D-manno-heptose 6-epimerase